MKIKDRDTGAAKTPGNRATNSAKPQRVPSSSRERKEILDLNEIALKLKKEVALAQVRIFLE